MYKEKIISLIKSSALTEIWAWSKSCHLSLLVLCVLQVLMAGATLGMTLTTKGLVDGATGQDLGQIKLYGLLLFLMVLLIRGCALPRAFCTPRPVQRFCRSCGGCFCSVC